MRKFALCVGLAISFGAGFAEARDPFSLTLTVDGITERVTFSKLENLDRSLSTDGLRSIIDVYTDRSAASAILDLRGVFAIASFDTDSPVLRFQVPALGIDEFFRGRTRDESRDLFEDWLRGRGQTEINRLLRYAAATTSADPVAGNPGSLTNQMVANDFARAAEAAPGVGLTGQIPRGLGLGARFGSFSAAGFRSRSLTIPLFFGFNLSDNDRIDFDVPVTLTDVSGAQSYAANLGILYRRKVTDWWTLQSAFRLGAVGSVDLGAAAGAYSIGLTSTLSWRSHDEKNALSLINSATYISTIPISIGDYSVDYGLKNLAFRNGVVFSRDLGLALVGQNLIASAYVIDTRITGDAVFIRNYQEFGIQVQLGRNLPLQVSAGFLTGDRNVSGFQIGGGIRF